RVMPAGTPPARFPRSDHGSVGLVTRDPEAGPAPGFARGGQYPLGGRVTLADLETDPHPGLARLRERYRVSWLPALGGWLVTRRDLALRVLRDTATFTVDDLRFS